MKKSLILIYFLFSFLPHSFSQHSNGFNFQAVIRDRNQQLLSNRPIGIRISILQGATQGTTVYEESQITQTNANGLITLEIGTGNNQNDFAAIQWDKGPYFIKTETDPEGGDKYCIVGINQLLSVPYALHAQTAEKITGQLSVDEKDPKFESWDKSTGIIVSPKQIINLTDYLANKIDSMGLNKKQLISIGNDTIFLSDGGFVKLPKATSFNGDFYNLTNIPPNLDVDKTDDFDGFFSSLKNVPNDILDGDNDTQLSEQQVDAFVANNGFLTAEVDGSVTNELQFISISNDTIFLSDGGFVKLPKATSFNGDFYNLTNIPPNLDVDKTDDFDGFFSSLKNVPNDILDGDNDTQLSEQQVDAFVANNGFLTAEIDGSVTNELQFISISNDTIFLSDGGFVKLPKATSFNGDFNNLTNIPPNLDVDKTDDFNGFFSSLKNVPNDILDGDNDTQLSEQQVDAFVANNGFLTAEVDGSVTNELQFISISNDTIFLSDGGFVKLPKASNDYYANLDELIWDDESGDDKGNNTNILNAAIASGKKVFLKTGTLTIKGRIRLDQAPFNSYSISGCGESTRLKFIGANSGFFDKYARQNNENYHTKFMGNFYMEGDGTNTGINFQSLSLRAVDLTINGFEKGIYLNYGGYGSKFENCFVRNNKYGIYIDSLVTTVEFSKLYASVHNDPQGAAIYFHKPVEMIKISGIIQANKAPAIWYGPLFSGDVDIECYFELNGDQDNNINAIRNDANKGRISYRNCKIPHNEGTWKNGKYSLGHDVLCDNCRLCVEANASNSLSLSNCLIDGGGGVSLDAITKISGIMQFGSLYGTHGADGFGFRVPAVMKTGTYDLVNIHNSPWSLNGTAVKATGNNRPSVSIDNRNKLGQYNSTIIMFSDNVEGKAGVNCVYLLPDGDSNRISAKPGEKIILSFFAKANKSGSVIVNVTGTGSYVTPIYRTIKLSTEWRKFVFIGNNPTTNEINGFGYLFCGESIQNFNMNITGITIHDNVPTDKGLLNEIMDGFLVYQLPITLNIFA